MRVADSTSDLPSSSVEDTPRKPPTGHADADVEEAFACLEQFRAEWRDPLSDHHAFSGLVRCSISVREAPDNNVS